MIKLVIMSGGFDPIHDGHLSLVDGARKIAGPKGKVICIINNNDFLCRKKGRPFYPDEQTRYNIMSHIKGIDYVTYSIDRDDTVCATLKFMHDLYNSMKFRKLGACLVFVNGGDRGNSNTPEANLCKELGIELVYGVGGEDKKGSSSELQFQNDESKGD